MQLQEFMQTALENCISGSQMLLQAFRRPCHPEARGVVAVPLVGLGTKQYLLVDCAAIFVGLLLL